MHRRSFLANGVAATATAGLLAGCIGTLGDGGSSDGSGNREPGLAPNPRDVEAPDADPSEFERLDVDGTSVPLVPIDVAHPWYLRQEARFVDARAMAAYEDSHVAGAVQSPAPDGYDESDPTNAWPTSERTITYCGCPHFLSSRRAASLIENGHEAVFALDEGFGEWFEREYPMRSSSGAVSLAEQRTVAGAVDPSYAGEFVDLRHEPTGQLEPAKIAADGSFEVSFRFVEIDKESPLVLETPAWTQTGTVAELTSGTIR